MRISGRKIARRMEERIRDELQELEVSPQVALLQVGSHPAIDSFVRIKQKVAERVGITLVHHQLAHDVTTQDVLDEIGLLIRTELAGGVKKGALTEEQAEKKFNAWLEEKATKVQAKADGLSKADAEAKALALEAEKAVNEARIAAAAPVEEAEEAEVATSEETTASNEEE